MTSALLKPVACSLVGDSSCCNTGFKSLNPPPFTTGLVFSFRLLEDIYKSELDKCRAPTLGLDYTFSLTGTFYTLDVIVLALFSPPYVIKCSAEGFDGSTLVGTCMIS